MTEADRNTIASIRQRLLNRARSRGEDFQLLLDRYASERFLYRLSISEHRERFVLKGATLFVLWEGELHRITRDIDLLGYGPPEVEAFVRIIREVCQEAGNGDGITFDESTISGASIRENQSYEGIRIRFEARLGNARAHIQLDIGFGDSIKPDPQEAELPTILDLPPPVLRAYPRVTVVAEKLQAMVALGMINSRMKDFYDLFYLSKHYSFAGDELVEAVEATFERRKTALPEEPPIALSDAFASDRMKADQWTAFCRRTGLETNLDLAAVISDLRPFLLPVLDAAASMSRFELTWRPPGPWRKASTSPDQSTDD